MSMRWVTKYFYLRRILCLRFASRKLSPKFVGPIRILEFRGKNAVKIEPVMDKSKTSSGCPLFLSGSGGLSCTTPRRWSAISCGVRRRCDGMGPDAVGCWSCELEDADGATCLRLYASWRRLSCGRTGVRGGGAPASHGTIEGIKYYCQRGIPSTLQPRKCRTS